MAIIDEIKASFKQGSIITRLIYINIAVFIVVKLWFLIFVKIIGTQDMRLTLDYWLSAAADLGLLIRKPWSVFTYMFVHANFFHIFFNMYMLFWFGRIFLQYFTQKQLLSVYLLGGLFGFLVHAAFYNALYNTGPGLVGASAATIAILTAIAFYVPNYTVNLMFIGPVKLIYIALVFILIDVLEMASMDGIGHLAHLGGALYGYLFIYQYKKGKEMGKGFNRFLDSLFAVFQSRKKMKVTYKNTTDDFEYNKQKVDKQEEIDAILDKIAKSGYKSLSKSEKEKLFKMSKE